MFNEIISNKVERDTPQQLFVSFSSGLRVRHVTCAVELSQLWKINHCDALSTFCQGGHALIK